MNRDEDITKWILDLKKDLISADCNLDRLVCIAGISELNSAQEKVKELRMFISALAEDFDK